MYLNKVLIIGNLTRDPELKALPSGINVCSFSIATNRVWKDKNGVKQENTDFHNVVVFGRQADTTAAYLKKGAMAYVEGRLTTRSWDGPDGKKNYRTEIIADTIQFGPRAGGQGGGSYGGGEGAGGGSYAPKPAAGKSADDSQDNPLDTLDTASYPNEEINPEDIPF
jgi:single-strand DNA-binding protein